MLSVTYIQTALKVEQDNVRSELSSFHGYIQVNCKGSPACGRHVFEQLLDSVKRLHLSCRWRRLEVHILPEVRNSIASVDRLLDELETMRLLGFDLYKLVRDRLRKGLRDSDFGMQDLYLALELYVQTIEAMIEKENEELFTVLFDLMPADRWFSIAEKFMLQDSEEVELGQVHTRYAAFSDPQSSPSRQIPQRVESSVSGPAQPDMQAEPPSGECIERNPFHHPPKGCFWAAQTARCSNC